MTSTLAPAVGQDVARLVRRVVPVDRRGVGAEQARRHAGLEEREVVAQHQRHAVALADAERREAAGRARGIGLDLGPAAEPLAGCDACRHRFFPFAGGPILAPAPFIIVSPRKYVIAL